MNHLKQALVELLSGLTIRKNEKEIWTKLENGDPITVEPIDDENYILRGYYKNGRLHWTDRMKNDQLHGVSKGWHENGNLEWKMSYKNDQESGLCKWWYENGCLEWEYNFDKEKIK